MGKRDEGGLKDGLLNAEYDIFPLNREDKEPIVKGIKMEMIKFDLLLVFIIIDMLRSRYI